MTTATIKIISSDSHTWEPRELWEKRKILRDNMIDLYGIGA